MRYDIATLKSRLGAIRTDDNPAILKQKSRDFYWYSPTLKRQLDQVIADIMVMPKNLDELIHVLATCHSLGIPVTPRGTGTGNYGQAMPLSGGVLLDLSAMNAVKSIGNGRVVTEPGAILAEIDHETREKSGQELRLSPSTYHTATLGGFIAGGSGGVGSIRWGGLRDYGNIIRLKVVTMEASPRVLELTGDDLHKVSHAYGTNGIIVECEVPLAPAYPWVDVIFGFDDLRQATEFSNSLGEQDGLLLKELAVIAAPAPHDYFLRHRKFLPRDKHAVVLMVADFALLPLLAFARRWKGAELLMRSDTLADDEKKGLPPAFELAWNHTTLRALRVDPGITYLQVLYPFPNQVELVEKIHAHFGEEVACHLEFVKFDGKVTCFGLPLVKFTSEERLEEIMRIHEEMGAPIFNPHRYTLEEGGMKQTDEIQLAFKREADPQGLLNPGKMIAWEDPNYDFRSGKTFLFKGLGG
ncbi:MAG: FAD-binding oxidoreductase [Methylobacterium sp.]|nr:FAD-binding oxidoreductase [Methylobacterium sp.]MCA3658442.1 FAD-binding oxidoreductase [Methylobacterium sp.]MCA3664073.1 FAD-binding oxidoreductase [Methylobacterium sp.]MCA3665999.1 FAD-binding oxidoreductase [Methylobacterium sp.]MCA3672056.1 FAD-binding oxidoreductase [Methylobacterium sp.]